MKFKKESCEKFIIKSNQPTKANVFYRLRVRKFVHFSLTYLYHFVLEDFYVSSIVKGEHVVGFGKLTLGHSDVFTFLDSWGQRILILDDNRIARRSRKYHMLRQRLNETKKMGFVSKVKINLEFIPDMNLMSSIHPWWNARLLSDFTYPDFLVDTMVGVSILDADGNLVAVACATQRGDFARMLLCVTTMHGGARWLATEELIQELHTRGVETVHSDGLLGLDLNGYDFQNRLGFQTVNLRESN